MARIEKEVTIEAPLEEIFEYVNDPANLPEFWPSIMDVQDIKRLPNGGYAFRWFYKMVGMRFEGTSETTDLVRNQWLVSEAKGGIGAKETWTFRARGDLTRITLTIEYAVPIPLLGRMAEAIIVKMNDQEADLIMANLRARFMGPGS